MGLRGIGANPIGIRPTAEVLANRDPHPWEKKGLSRAERVAVFLETLPVSSGSQRGTNFKVRDWQWKEIIEPIYATNADGRRFVREAVISLPRKNGKALALDTPIPTPSGFRMMAELQSGDQVFGPDGSIRNIVYVTEPMYGHECYRVEFTDGAAIVADADHLWLTDTRKDRENKKGKLGKTAGPKPSIKTTREIAATLFCRDELNHRVTTPNAFQLPTASLPVDPYVLGVWLGDGTSKNATVTMGRQDIEELCLALNACGQPTAERKQQGRASSVLLGTGERSGASAKASTNRKLRLLGVLNNKHVPEPYFWASEQQRLSLLQGLMDTDGYVSAAGQCEFTTTRKALAEGVETLLWGLGLKPLVTEARAMLNGRDIGPKWRIQFWAFSDRPVFRLSRKIGRLRDKPIAVTRSSTRQIIKCDPVESVPVKCIKVDAPDGMFLCGESFIPTHNTGLVMGLLLCHLVGPEAVERGQCFSAANAQKQAGLIFNELEAVIKRRKWMAERLNVQRFKKKIEDIGITGSTYESMASEVHTEHGLSTYFWIYDELGQTKDNGDLYRVLSTSGGAWEEPLGIIISTQAASSMHIMSELIDDGLQIRNGIVDDPSRYACVYTAPLDADPWSEETWHQCNPALGDFRSLEDMRDFAKKAKRIPAQESTFRNLFLNQRVAREAKWIPPATWDLCGQDPVEFNLESLKGRECFAALDLSGSGKNDLTALNLIFPIEDQLKVLPFFWCAEAGLEEAEHRDRVPYRLWTEQRHLIAVPGATFEFKGVAAKIGEISTNYKIKLLAVDPWAFDKMRAELDELGLNLLVKVHDQSIKGMDPAVKATENAIIAGKLRHNKNPILTWCMNNVNLLSDSSGNRKLDKRKSTGRIDGAVAMAMACNLAASLVVEPSYQVMFV